MYQYILSGDPGYHDYDDPPYPDLAALKGMAQKIRDNVSALVHNGDGADAVDGHTRNFRALKEIETEALAIANALVDLRIYWEDRRRNR